MNIRAAWAPSRLSGTRSITQRATVLGTSTHHLSHVVVRPAVESRLPVSKGAGVSDLTTPRPETGLVEQMKDFDVFQTYQLSAEVADNIKQGYLAELKQYDYIKDVDELEEAAYRLLADTLPDEVQLGLRRVLVDKDFPPAIALKGLPLEDNIPPALHKPPIPRVRNILHELFVLDAFTCSREITYLLGFELLKGDALQEDHLVEAIMLGLGRFWGHCFNFDAIARSGVFSEYVAIPSHQLPSETAQSTAVPLGMHRDFPFASPEQTPEIRLITAIRQDKERRVKTFISNNRNVYSRLTKDEIHLLRTQAVTVRAGEITFPSFHVIQGPEDDPTISLFTSFEGLPPDYKAEGSTPELSAAYWRANELATKFAQWTKIEAGMCLIFNNLRVTHARSPAPVEADGMGRWIKNTLVSTKATPARRMQPSSRGADAE